MGSGNIGATNVHRSVGGKAGVIVLALDILKGFLAVWLAALLTNNNPLALALSAVAVMLGHCYPVFLRFQGGKAVACFVGAFLYIAPAALAVTAIVFFVVLGMSKYVSLGSVVGAICFPLIVWPISHPPRPILAAALASCLLIIYRHKGNISRLRSGKENRFSFRGGRKA